MGKRCWIGMVAAACAMLAGCAEQSPAPMTPDRAVALLMTGRPLLRCRQECLGAWRKAQPEAADLAAGGKWRDLATLVLRIGYQDDLSLYYLGEAAAGLSYPLAAASFYRQSMELSGTTIACAHLSHLCGGVELPRAAALRVADIDRLLNRPRRRPAAVPQKSPAPGSAADAGTPPVSEPTPAPVAPVPPADVNDYIEPPPAR
jgi:hypothetical protein